MAVDNINKRASLSGRRQCRLRPQPDGTIDAPDRRQLDGIYRGAEVVPPPGGTIFLKPGKVFGPP